jgi:excisionase family DNA binding protein
MDATNIPNDLVTPNEAAAALKVSAGSIRRWVHVGKLPGFRIGGRLRVSLADALAAVQVVQPAGGPRPETRSERRRRDAETDRVLRAAGVRR